MFRAILPPAAVAVAAMAFFAPAAEACISCEYVPEVVRNSSTSNDAKPYKRERAYSATSERRSRATKRFISKHETAAPKTVEKRVAKPVDTADKEPTKATAENEHSTVTTATGSELPAKKVDTAATATTSDRENENSTIVVKTVAASNDNASKPTVEEAKADANVGCKKFFPSVGMTLSVPCE